MFDSPVFWAILIWWLLSNFLGSKRKRQRAIKAPPPQPGVGPEPVKADEAPPQPEEQAPLSPLDLLKRRPPSQVGSLKELWAAVAAELSPSEPVVRDFAEEVAPDELIIEEVPPPPPPPPAKPRIVTEAKPAPLAVQSPLQALTTESQLPWSPMQQAIILREIFDRPVGLRPRSRGIRR